MISAKNNGESLYVECEHILQPRKHIMTVHWFISTYNDRNK